MRSSLVVNGERPSDSIMNSEGNRIIVDKERSAASFPKQIEEAAVVFAGR